MRSSGHSGITKLLVAKGTLFPCLFFFARLHTCNTTPLIVNVDYSFAVVTSTSASHTDAVIYVCPNTYATNFVYLCICILGDVCFVRESFHMVIRMSLVLVPSYGIRNNVSMNDA